MQKNTFKKVSFKHVYEEKAFKRKEKLGNSN